VGREVDTGANLQWQHCLDAVAAPVALLGPDGEWLHANAALRELLAYPRGALPSLAWHRLVHPDDRARLHRDFLQRLREGATLFPIEYRCRRGGSDHLWLRHAARRSDLLPDGCVVATFENIDALKRRSAALETSERRRRQGQRLAQLGSWELDLGDNSLHWSEEVYTLFGVDATDFTPGYQAFVDAVHPDDRELVDRAHRRSVERGETYRIVHRLAREGGPDFVEERGETFFDDAGNPIRCIGTVQDVSHRVLLENELQAAVTRMAAVLVSTPDGYIAANLQGTVLEVNQAYCQQSGYSEAELQGKPLWELDAHDEAPVVLRRLQSLKEAGALTFETEHRRKDGSTWPVEVSGSYSDVDGGRVFSFVRDISERREAAHRIEHMAYHDLLTGLPNRELFADRLRQATRLAQRSGQNIAVCYVDIDGFKPVNDRYGHDVGDALLIEVARRMVAQLRDGDTVARLGGDEFVVLLTDVRGAYTAEETVERLLRAVAEPVYVASWRIQVSASIGVTLFPEDNSDPDTLLRHADQAMYRAKESGKGLARLFDTVEQRRVSKRRRALQDIERALTEDQLCLHFQPRIVLRTGAVVGAEALLRWQHPTRGLLAPAEILPLIKGTALEVAVDQWVLARAVEQHMRFREQGLHLPLSINVSPQYLQMREFVDYVDSLLRGYPDDVARCLELEILETSAIGNTSRVAENMRACAALGIVFSIDDFGTGYSSLTYFRRLPISILKIDQHFVCNLMDSTQDHDIVEGVLLLARALSRPVVAEGVEKTEIALLLQGLGCEYAQGYGIARPMPPEDMPAWVHRWEQGAFRKDLHLFQRGEFVEQVLLAALFAHERWLDRFRRHVDSGFALEPPPLDEHECMFGRWCTGIGVQRFKDRPFFHRIEHAHSQIHRLARETIAAHDNGAEVGTVIECMRRVEAEGCKLESLVDALDGEIAASQDVAGG